MRNEILSGARVALSGKFSLPRQELAALLTEAGAKVMASVGKTTDRLFFGERASAKVGKAARMAIPAHSERELLALLGRPVPLPVIEGPLSDYVARFEAMVAELEADPRVHVINAWVGMPASEQAIADAERALGAELPHAMRNLYRQANGLSLRWIAKGTGFDPATHRRVFGPDKVLDDDDGSVGCVRLEPLAGLLEDWEGVLWFDSRKDDRTRDFMGESVGERSFAKGLALFDWYHFYEMAALATHPRAGEPPVVLGSDGGACWDDEAQDFETYMESLLSTYAAIEARRRLAPPRSLDELLGEESGPAEPSILRRRRVLTKEGAYVASEAGWTREVGDPADEAGWCDGLADIAFDSAGAAILAGRAGVWRLDAEGAERLYKAPNKAWGRSVAVTTDDAIAFGAGDRLVVLPSGGKPRVWTGKKAFWERSGVASLSAGPDGSLLVGVRGAVATVRPGAEPELDAALLRGVGGVGCSETVQSEPDGGLLVLLHSTLVRRDASGEEHRYALDVGDRGPVLMRLADGSIVVCTSRHAPAIVRPGAEAAERWEVIPQGIGAEIETGAVDRAGDAWFIDAQHNLYRVVNGQTVTFSWASSMPTTVGGSRSGDAIPRRMKFAPDGSLWIVMDAGIVVVDAESLAAEGIPIPSVGGSDPTAVPEWEGYRYATDFDHLGARIGHRAEDATEWLRQLAAQHAAALAGFEDLIAWLLARGADPDVAAPGMRLLGLAVRQGSVRLTRSLIDAGADPHLAMSSGLTPAGLGWMSGDGALHQLLGISEPLSAEEPWCILFRASDWPEITGGWGSPDDARLANAFFYLEPAWDDGSWSESFGDLDASIKDAAYEATKALLIRLLPALQVHPAASRASNWSFGVGEGEYEGVRAALLGSGRNLVTPADLRR